MPNQFHALKLALNLSYSMCCAILVRKLPCLCLKPELLDVLCKLSEKMAFACVLNLSRRGTCNYNYKRGLGPSNLSLSRSQSSLVKPEPLDVLCKLSEKMALLVS